MIQRQLKLRLNTSQEQQLTTWLFQLTGVWNWAIRKIGLDAQDGIHYTRQAFHNLLADHGKKIGIPSHTLQGVLDTAYTAWQQCYKKLAKQPRCPFRKSCASYTPGKPAGFRDRVPRQTGGVIAVCSTRLKGQRNKLTGIPFPDPFTILDRTHIHVPGIGHVRFHAQDIPPGRIKSGRIVKRASGWYLCLFIDAAPQTIASTGNAQVGIDPGFHHLLTLSSGEKIPHPRELEATEQRLAQAQRGGRKQLAMRLHERLVNRRKDRNHKLSRRLVADHSCLVRRHVHFDWYLLSPLPLGEG